MTANELAQKLLEDAVNEGRFWRLPETKKLRATTDLFYSPTADLSRKVAIKKGAIVTPYILEGSKGRWCINVREAIFKWDLSNFELFKE